MFRRAGELCVLLLIVLVIGFALGKMEPGKRERVFTKQQPHKRKELLDRTVADSILRDVADRFRTVESLQVEGQQTHSRSFKGMKTQSTSKFSLNLRRPNLVALRITSDNESLRVICDGEQLFTIAGDDDAGAYTQEVAPPTFDGMLDNLNLGFLYPGNELILKLLASHAHATLTEGVTEMTIDGVERVNGTPAHQLVLHKEELSQINKWCLWVATGNDPVVLKASFAEETPGGWKAVSEVNYSNWDFNAEPPGDAFQFVPGEKFKKVDKLFPMIETPN